jgi:lipopolysaccharide export system permease protein
LLPSILLYLAYLTLLSGARSAMDEGEPYAVVKFWGIHLAFGLLAVNLHFAGRFWRSLINRSVGLISAPGKAKGGKA